MKKNDFIYQLSHDKSETLSSFHFENPDYSVAPCYGAPWHFHRAIEITYITKGSVKCFVGNKEIAAKKDDIIFIPPYYLHTYFVSPDSSYTALIISDKMWEDFREIFADNIFPLLLENKEFNHSLLPVWKILIEQINNNLVKKGLANVILGKLAECYPTEAVKPFGNANMIAQALAYVEEHFTEPLTLDLVANALGYNKYYFSRNFNRYVGENFNNYVNMLRIRQVIRQLKKEPNASLNELVFNSGFNSISTFYRIYKMFYNDSPKNYLK